MDIPKELPYEKVDICALFANAIDNAAEACVKLEKKERKIVLKSKAKKGLFCMTVTNPAPSLEKKHHRKSCLPLPNQIKKIMVLV